MCSKVRSNLLGSVVLYKCILIPPSNCVNEKPQKYNLNTEVSIAM